MYIFGKFNILLSLNIKIPVHSRILPFYTVVNLGRLGNGTHIKVDLPKAAVITDKLRPLGMDICLFYGETLICSEDAIGSEDHCLLSVFKGSESGCVKHTIPDARTCLSNKREDSVIVSLTKKTSVHSMYNADSHVVQPMEIDKFSVVQKSEHEQLIICEKNTRSFQDTIRIGKRNRKAQGKNLSLIFYRF